MARRQIGRLWETCKDDPRFEFAVFGGGVEVRMSEDHDVGLFRQIIDDSVAATIRQLLREIDRKPKHQHPTS
jgi:hypothetical protein